MKKLTVFCILALLVVLFVVPAYAEVQNVKVSGDVAAKWLMRWNLDLDKNNAGVSNAADDFLMSTAEVQVEGDLTDNVTTVVRLVNQRDWNDVRNETSMLTTSAANVSNTSQFDILVDLANVTLKEFVYSPLTLTIGRQDLWYGKGFIIGAKQRDPQGQITAKEYTAINSFDAIKASLDFDPWKLDGVYALTEENVVNKQDDQWLAGVNLGYKFSSYKGEAEAYYFQKHDNSGVAYPNTTTLIPVNPNTNFINTFGVRGSLEPIANATLAGETAFQNGRYSDATNSSRARNAYAMDFSGDYAFKDVKWSPKVGLEWIAYSGEDQTAAGGSTGTYNGWNPMYRGKFDTAIREFQNVYYATAMRADNTNSTVTDQDSGVSNETQLLFIGSVKPTNTLKLDGRFAWFQMMKTQMVSGQARSKNVGTELDMSLTYDYTEDVSFNLLAGWFFPGKYWISGQDDIATDLVGSVKVAF